MNDKNKKLKKSSIILLIFFGFGFLIYHLASDLHREHQPANILPANTLFYFEMIDPVDRFKDFKQSKLGKQIAHIDWLTIAPELGIPEHMVSEIDVYVNEILNFVNSPLCNELFGRQVTLAMLKPETEKGLDIEKIRESFVLISSPRHQTTLLEALSSWFIKDLKYTTEKYHDRSIKHFELENDLAVSVAVEDDMLLASFSSSIIKICLDTMDGGGKKKTSSLATNQHYKELRAESVGNDDTFSYLDVKEFSRIFKDLGKQYGRFVQGVIPQQIENTGILAAGFFREAQDDKYQYTSLLKIDGQQKGPFVDLLKDGVIDSQRLVASVPADLLIYYWTNWFSPESLWRFLSTDNSKGNDAARKIEKWIENASGVELSEFLQMFGNQFSFHISGVSTTGFFPVPRMSFALEVKDYNGVGKVLDKLLSDLPVKKSSISGVDVLSVMVAGGLMQPSCALLENSIVIADSREQLALILDDKRSNLSDDVDYKKVNVGLEKASNQVLFIRAAEVNEAIQQLASWVGTIIAIRNINAGVKSKIIVDQVIIPLLEGLKMYQLAGHRGFHKNNTIFFQSAVVVKKQ